jgi:hypothetical protein
MRIISIQMKKNFLYLISTFGVYLIVSTFVALANNEFVFSTQIGIETLKKSLILITLSVVLSVLFYFVDLLIIKLRKKPGKPAR